MPSAVEVDAKPGFRFFAFIWKACYLSLVAELDNFAFFAATAFCGMLAAILFLSESNENCPTRKMHLAFRFLGKP